MPETSDEPRTRPPVPAGLLRRIAAAAYDGLLIIALFVIPTAGVMALRGGEPVPPGSILFQALLIATAGLFFIGFWTHGGQTLGMRAWRLRIEDDAGNPVTIGRGTIRFIVAIPAIGLFGLGILWLLIDPKHQTLPDRIAGTHVLTVAQKKKNN